MLDLLANTFGVASLIFEVVDSLREEKNTTKDTSLNMVSLHFEVWF